MWLDDGRQRIDGRCIELNSPARGVGCSVASMANTIPPVRANLPLCPMCHQPQVKIQRRLDGERLGTTNYVCSRTGHCGLAFDLKNVDTWVAVR
jgi:hypothetical protein